MTRGIRTLARYGLPGTDAVRADLAVAGLLPSGAAPPAATQASGESGAGESAGAMTEAGSQAVLVALARAGRPDLAVRQLAALVTALREEAGPANAADGTAAAGPSADHSLDPAADLLDTLQRDPGFRGRLIGLLGASEPLGDHLVTHPREWQVLADNAPFGEATSPDRCLAALDRAARDHSGNLLPATEAVAPLRTAYRTQLAVIAGSDVAGAVEPGPIGPDFGAVSDALTVLADALLTVSLDIAAAEHPSSVPIRLAVIAMGKCGAHELNYVSDVDVLFVVGGAESDADESAIIRTATRRASAMMHLCERVAWEVDASLRPEGRMGPLVRTLAGYAAYYRRWAKTWEFQALLKARAAAGDRQVGEDFLTMSRAEVWTAADRDSFVSDVQAMRRRVADSVPPDERGRDLKMGPGGLRDVEFAVQLLQLVHGRANEALRVSGTLDALEALTDGGYVNRGDGAELAAAYTFQRRIEHLLQLQHLLRTHSLPSSDEDRQWLARTDGYRTAGRGSTSAASRLGAELGRHAATVRRLHEKLFYRPLLTAVAAVPTDELRLTPKAAANRLAALGFVSAESALKHLAALTDGVSRRAAIQRTLLPVLLETFSDAPDPDAGLLGYRKVSDALAGTPWYLRLLRDEGLVAQRLAQLLGTSRLVTNLLQRAPEVLRLLVHDTDLAGRDPQVPAAVAASALLARSARAKTAVAAANAARSARRHEIVRLACADLLGLVDTDAVIADLTVIADATIQAALQAAHRQVLADRRDTANLGTAGAGDAATGGMGNAATGGAGNGVRGCSGADSADDTDGLAARVSVIAMGRFGGAEMGYSSDADVLFVAGPSYPDADPQQVRADATAVAELTSRLLARPSPDPVLRIDTDLRPEGRGGPLVRTVDSYREYWQRRAQPWERQALLKARAVGGDDEVTAAFLAAADEFRYPGNGLSPGEVREIRRIKARVDAERLPRGADRTLHTKLGRGGLADVEWTVQLLQLEHAGSVETLRVPGTMPAIRAAVDADLLSADDGAALTEGWTMATRARNAIMLVTGKPGDEIPAHGPQLAGIARACGYPAEADPGEFVDDYRRATRHARRAVDELFDRD